MREAACKARSTVRAETNSSGGSPLAPAELCAEGDWRRLAATVGHDLGAEGPRFATRKLLMCGSRPTAPQWADAIVRA